MSDESLINELNRELKYDYHKTTWNWRKCRNCKGTGETRNWGKMGRALGVEDCPTCGGKGGWPLYSQTDVDVNERIRRAGGGFRPPRLI